MRPSSRLIITGLLLLTGLAGCGGDDNAPSTSAQPVARDTSTTAAAPVNVVKQAAVTNVPLGTPEARILKKFGEPAGKPSNAKQNCLVYATDAGPDTWQRFCFVDGKLVNVATVIGRDTAMTLDVPPIEGPGTLQEPTVGSGN